MPGWLGKTVQNLLQTRDELSLRNMRGSQWPLLLIFPLTVILGDFRYFNLNISIVGFESYELMLYPLGLGWLALVFIPKQHISRLLGIAAVFCAALLPFQLLLTGEIPKLAVFMAFQFLNGVCAGCAFHYFCFKLNNVERLSGMALIIFYYSLYYTIYRAFPAVQAVYKTWGGIAAMSFYLVVVFLLLKKPGKQEAGNKSESSNAANVGTAEGKDSIVKIVIGLHIVYYSIMCMINYIESADNIIYSLPYGLGQFSSIIIIVFIMLISNRNSLYIWLMFLVFSLFGLSIVNYDSPSAHFAGSLLYGLGDGLGYIIIYYLCSGAIKRSGSIRMYRLFCLILFIEYFFISGIFSRAFDSYEGSSHVIALSVVLVLCSGCFLILPVLQKKLFEADWTDGIHLKDMAEYTQSLAVTEAINVQNKLELSPREHEIFTMLLSGRAPKEIAYTLKISYDTVLYHQKKLYRKLEIQSITELFARYGN